MTAIVCVLNSRGIAMAADSAVTVSGHNMKKVYNRGNKIFTLSKYHPVGIALYNSADFMGIPFETIIKLYRKKIKDVPFGTVNEYKDDFLIFLKEQLRHVSDKRKEDAFYGFFNKSYHEIIKNISDALLAQENPIVDTVVTEELNKYLAIIQSYDRANYIEISEEQFNQRYLNELNTIIQYVQEQICKESSRLLTLSEEHKVLFRRALFLMVNLEWIFESSSGLVFFGFGDDEIYPSARHVLVGGVFDETIRIRELDHYDIVPGVMDSNIVPFAQGDVTTTVLTGVDPNFTNEVAASIKSSFNDVSTEISEIINNATQATAIQEAMNRVSEELVEKLNEYQFNTITKPLLDVLNHMEKEDMSELAESLVSITSLKRKFTSHDSADESVGGPVDVAIVTKGDGFIWMKRKHYFNIEKNGGFVNNYYKL